MEGCHKCYGCGMVVPDFVTKSMMCDSCLSKQDNLTEQGDDIEPIVCSVCGNTEAGAGEMNKGVFTCWECMKKSNDTMTIMCDNTDDNFGYPKEYRFKIGHIDYGPSDRMEEMMAMQADFNKKVGHVPHKGKSVKPNMRWLKKWLLCITQETAECMDYIPWKWWSKRSGNKLVEERDLYNEAHIKEIKLELIDIMHFLLSACLELRMDADEVYALYCEKMQVNHDRQEGEY